MPQSRKGLVMPSSMSRAAKQQGRDEMGAKTAESKLRKLGQRIMGLLLVERSATKICVSASSQHEATTYRTGRCIPDNQTKLRRCIPR